MLIFSQSRHIDKYAFLRVKVKIEMQNFIFPQLQISDRIVFL